MSDESHNTSWHPALRSHNSTTDVSRLAHVELSNAETTTADHESGEAPAFAQEEGAGNSIEQESALFESESASSIELHHPAPDKAEPSIPVIEQQEEDEPHDQTVVDEALGSLHTEEEQGHREQYEYQGQTTAADDAVDESDNAPLMQDEELLPTPGFATDAPAINPHDVPVTPFEGHSSTDNHSAVVEHVYEMSTEPPAASQEEETSLEEKPAFEWPDDDQTEDFAAVVGLVDSDNRQAASQETALTQALEEQAPEKQGEQPEKGQEQQEDLAALWSAALNDDDFLDENAVDPSGFFDDDGEGFLDDFDTTPAAVFSPEQASSPAITAVHDAQGNTVGFSKLGGPQEQINAPANPYAAASASTLPAVPLYNQVQQAAVRPTLKSAQSFADKSKGGYSSPYDLPEDIVQPRRRPGAAALPSQSSAPLAPPRNSSMLTVSTLHAPPQSISTAPLANMTSMASPPPQGRTLSVTSLPQRPSTASNGAASGFFEELPMAPKPRPRPYTPAITAPTPSQSLPMAPPSGPPTRPLSRPVMPVSSASEAHVASLFRQPERLPLLPDTQAVPQQLGLPQPTGPPPTSRYSPAIPATSSSAPISANFAAMPPPATSRYSPAPQAQNRYATMPAAAPASRPVQPFAPRTSSPLAFHEKPVAAALAPPVRSVSYQPPPPLHPVRRMSGLAEGFETPPRRNSNTLDQITSQPSNLYPTSPRTIAYTPTESSFDSRRAQTFFPDDARPSPNTLSPPKRSKTQSPGTVMKAPSRAVIQFDRPTSATTGPLTSPIRLHKQDARILLPPSKQQFSSDLNFTVPQDELAHDVLERYKGCPIFNWGPSGSLVSTFPNQAPFYAAGHAIPTIKCTPGHVTIHDTKATFPLDERDAKFPGPLAKGKSRKKDTLAWMSGKIEDLEKLNQNSLLDYEMPAQVKKRLEEKVILWKMVRLLLEHDNKLDGMEDAVRKILLPTPAQPDLSTEVSSDGVSSSLSVEPVDAKAMAQLRKHLLEGEREKAVWYASEQKLWSHALLIASVAGPEVWKQVVQEFVRSQVKDAGEKSESLAALYEVFAGNWEESIDELVPPSARAGFQMISKAGPTAKNPLDGLDQWRETLGLIISNRSNNDVQAIAALGKLLSSYGRSEAAHTCFLFAKASAHLGGADDEKSDFVLLGADHKNQSQELSNLDSILLTEIYELCISLAPAPGTLPTLHHLQAFKFQHAQMLTEHGLRTEAQSYCESILASFKASTRASPYYHSALLSCVDDLHRCLSQAPQASSSGGWIPKPSMDKVSGSMWKRFNTFVAGDDDEQKLNGTEGIPAGPFGSIPGETPTVSRATSSTDLYGAMSMHAGGVPASGNPALNRYAPPAQLGAASTARYAPSAYAPSRGSMDSPRSNEFDRPGSGYSSLVSPTTVAPMPAPVQRASSTPFSAYLPRQAAEAQPLQPSLSVPRPEASRAVSDYHVQYIQPPPRRESVQSTNTSEPRSSLDQSRPAHGYQPEAARLSPYQSSSYTPLSPIYGDNASEAAYQQAMPSPMLEYQPSGYTPTALAFDSADSSHVAPSSYEARSYDAPSFRQPSPSFEPPSDEPLASPYAPSAHDPVSSYEPPTSSSGYEPPTVSYEPYEPEADQEEDGERPRAPPKKKSFMDDDEDDDEIIRRAAALKKQAEDSAADAAFRAAAEEDSKREDKSNGDKKGWFGGWFGKKDPNAPAQGPIRAKLGEQSSFYYDPELKKWINKKGGADATAATSAAGTPPPPKGPPSRSVSALSIGPPTSGPPSRAMTPAGGLPSGPPSGPPSLVSSPAMQQTGFTSSSAPPPLSGMTGGPPSSGPPSRPTTGMSNASSIDDLLGAIGPRKGGNAKTKKRGGRYVDVMAKP
jgi:hypothetical protein